MDAGTVFRYWRVLKAIRANEQKNDIVTAIYPHLKESQDRDKVQRSLSQSYTTIVSDGDFMKERELNKILEERKASKR